jgi:hypothetical protein
MQGRHTAQAAKLLCGLFLCLSVGGCAFGPRALERTHGQYNDAVRRVYEEQLLASLVHLRYTENPTQLDVSAIAAQYELSSQAEARPFFLSPNPSNSNVIFKTFTSILPDVLIGANNRPTITFTPADDGSDVRRLLTPISADTLVLLTQMGWPVSTVLRLWTERLNGVPNAVPAAGPRRDVIPEFDRFLQLVELLRIVQDRELITLHATERLTELSGPLPEERITAAAVVEAAKGGLEYRPREDGKTWVVVRRQKSLVLDVSPGAEDSPELAEMARLLNLQPGQRRYELVVGAGGYPDPLRFPTKPSTVLHVVPRSTAEVFYYLSNGVEVPPEHLACGLVRSPADADGQLFDMREVTRGLFAVQVCKGHKPPPDAYVAVKYRGYWYYVDDRDESSKATLGMMLQLSRLDFARQRISSGPVLTLPAGR